MGRGSIDVAPIFGRMAQPMIAARIPNACAACYGQYPDRVHVDYRSAIEGGLVDPSRPRGPHVDWVVICEKCLRDGVALLSEAASERDADRATIAALRERVRELETYSEHLAAAVAVKPAEREPAPTPAAAKPARPTRYSPKGKS